MDGLNSLLQDTPYCRKSVLEGDAERIMSSLDQSPVHSIKEACTRIKEVCGISRQPTQVRSFLYRHGYRWRKMGQVPGRADPEKQKRWCDNLQPCIHKANEGSCRLLFSDAVHFTLFAFLCNAWSKERLYLKTAAGRNRINVLGAVDALAKEVTIMDNTTYVTTETIISFLEKLREDSQDTPIVIVMDNARYQHCKAVEERAKQLNIEILFLPPYSPNLNVIERLWKFTRKAVLYGRYYDTPDKFHQAIRTFFEGINQKYQVEMETLLTLNFQIVEMENAQNDAA
jgi:transposase